MAPIDLMINGDFERTDGDRPRDWRPVTWSGAATLALSAEGRHGGRCVMIESTSGADGGWQVTIPVEINATYRLSGWVKTRDLRVSNGRGALLNLHNIQPQATRALLGTNDWTRLELVFETGMVDSVQVNCLFGGWGKATGRAWYDDLRLELVERREWAPRIEIDAGRIGAPISPLIYGQFIEHLGRCIDGGIWAEMVADRKFFHPVGAKESPWRVEPPTAELSMDSDRAFAGEASPVVEIEDRPAGLVQGELGVLAGKEYVGRIWLAAGAGVEAVEVSLRWGKGAGGAVTVRIDQLSETFRSAPLRFRAGGTSDAACLQILGLPAAAGGRAPLAVGAVSLMPADNEAGMRRDTLQLLRRLDAPIYRWPGGNFVSGYDWRDGIGERDRRPPRKNPAWTGIESNDFGIDEFMRFCERVGAEAYVVVNSGLGDESLAAAEVSYLLGGEDSPMGRRRAVNGHPAPYQVRYWGIGNEMYGNWQLGHVSLDEYLLRHRRFANAMRRVAPEIELVGVGAVGPWSERMLATCADAMNLISEHFYCQESPGLAGHVWQIPNAIRGIAAAHRRYRDAAGTAPEQAIPVAVDEWNYWYGPHLYGELGVRYHLKDALGVAAGLQELANQSDLFQMANYAQTVNVIGCIKTSKTAAAFATTGLPLMLYRKHFGRLPVAADATPPLHVAAAWAEPRRVLTIGIVNPTRDDLKVALDLRGATLVGDGTLWEIGGDDPEAYNEPGQPSRVVIEEREVHGAGAWLPVSRCSVSLFALDVE